jgi:hypothetical protein
MAAPAQAAIACQAQGRKGCHRRTGDEREPHASRLVGQSTVHVVTVRLIRTEGDDDFAQARVAREPSAGVGDRKCRAAFALMPSPTPARYSV